MGLKTVFTILKKNYCVVNRWETLFPPFPSVQNHCRKSAKTQSYGGTGPCWPPLRTAPDHSSDVGLCPYFFPEPVLLSGKLLWALRCGGSESHRGAWPPFITACNSSFLWNGPLWTSSHLTLSVRRYGRSAGLLVRLVLMLCHSAVLR